MVRKATVGPAVRQKLRETFGLLIYRMVVTFTFLLVAFSQLPDLRGVIAFGVVCFSACIAAVTQFVDVSNQVNNRLMDEAERKTRHVIILAQRYRDRPDYLATPSFWSEANAAVDEEMADERPAPNKLQTVGLVTINIAWRLFGDLVFVGLAYIMTGG